MIDALLLLLDPVAPHTQCAHCSQVEAVTSICRRRSDDTHLLGSQFCVQSYGIKSFGQVETKSA